MEVEVEVELQAMEDVVEEDQQQGDAEKEEEVAELRAMVEVLVELQAIE